jgi:hypothetical protein
VVLDGEGCLVGCIEVKKPSEKGKSVLDEPTVLGQLYDQMRMIEACTGRHPCWHSHYVR